MKNVDYSKYDKDSADQLRFIHIKTAIEELEKRIGELGKQVDRFAKDYIFSNVDLVNRIKVLEEARQKQISLNSTFVQKGTEAKTEIKVSKPKGLWDWVK